MRLRFTRTAASQLDPVIAVIAAESPQGAHNLYVRLQAVLTLLRQHLFAGQATVRAGFRRIVISPYPYLLTYRVGDGEIVIRSVRHGARKPLV